MPRTRRTTPRSPSTGTKDERAFLLEDAFQNAFVLTVLLFRPPLPWNALVTPQDRTPAPSQGRQGGTGQCRSPTALTGAVSMLGPPLPKIIYRNSQNVYGPPWKPNGAAHFCLQKKVNKGKHFSRERGIPLQCTWDHPPFLFFKDAHHFGQDWKIT